MTRHSKNCTAHSVYTYHEKKRDTQTSGYGSTEVRLGRDSMKEFDCCCLTLQPCREPVMTPDGYLYDKEAILEYIIKRKREIARQQKEYAKQKAKSSNDDIMQLQLERNVKVSAFVATNSLKNVEIEAEENRQAAASISNMAGEKSKELPSFWIPNNTPSANASKIAKPDETIRCPMSGKILRFKDLIDVKFDAVQDDDEAFKGKKKSVISKEVRYKCAVTGDVLTNATPCCVLKTSGRVVTQACVDKLIRPDMRDLITDQPLKDSDIVFMQRGSTGFASSGNSLIAKKSGPAMQA